MVLVGDFAQLRECPVCDIRQARQQVGASSATRIPTAKNDVPIHTKNKSTVEHLSDPIVRRIVISNNETAGFMSKQRNILPMEILARFRTI
jgi:hypothetical protein